MTKWLKATITQEKLQPGNEDSYLFYLEDMILFIYFFSSRVFSLLKYLHLLPFLEEVENFKMEIIPFCFSVKVTECLNKILVWQRIKGDSLIVQRKHERKSKNLNGAAMPSSNPFNEHILCNEHEMPRVPIKCHRVNISPC